MSDRERNDPNLDAPEKLRAALAQSQARRIVVPPAIDAAILRTARERLEPVRESSREHIGTVVAESPLSPRERAGVRENGRKNSTAEFFAKLTALFVGRRFAPLTAAVATVVAAGVLAWLTVHPRAAARPEDLNADGQVDMLDAFALARELQEGRTPRPQLDLNGDGVVDERDVQLLGDRAVSLEPGGRS